MAWPLSSRTKMACCARRKSTDFRTSFDCKATVNPSSLSVTENSYGEFGGRRPLRVLTSSSTSSRSVLNTPASEHKERPLTQSYLDLSISTLPLGCFSALSFMLAPLGVSRDETAWRPYRSGHQRA